MSGMTLSVKVSVSQTTSSEKGSASSNLIMAVNIPGLIVIIIFYLLVLATGIWASFKSKRKQKKCAATELEMALLGNRSINWAVGIFTMTGEQFEFQFNHHCHYTVVNVKTLK